MLENTELKIAVVDDLQHDRIQMAEMTRRILSDANISHSIFGYADGAALLEDMRSGKKYNLLLLDVLMDALDGMALAQALRDQGNQTMIVFISACQEMARQGYKVQALRYVAKPLEIGELREALLHCHKQWQAKREILLPTDNGHHRISFPDIQFVEAFERGTRFVLSNETVYSSLKFSEVEAILPKSEFILCHRAFYANVAHIKRIRPNEFVMRSGDRVPISKHRYPEVSKRFLACISD